MDIFLEQIKLLSGNTNEALISLIIDKTMIEISDYRKMDFDICNERMTNVLVDMAVVKLNRFGTEGLSSQSYSGVSESYIDEYPHYILKQLNSIKYSKNKKWGIL